MQINYINKKINQIYKLLPLYEDDKNWEEVLDNIIFEFEGLYQIESFDDETKTKILEILAKLYGLKQYVSHKVFRKNIFDIITLIKEL